MLHFDVKSVVTAGEPEKKSTSHHLLYPLLRAPQAVQAHQKAKVKIRKGGPVKLAEELQEELSTMQELILNQDPDLGLNHEVRFAVVLTKNLKNQILS